MISIELAFELAARNLRDNSKPQQEKEPERAIVFSWRRVCLKLVTRDQLQAWNEVYSVIMAKSLQPETCRHDDLSLLQLTATTNARQTFCRRCKKTVVYDLTVTGVHAWMRTFETFVAKNILPPYPLMMHPGEPDAAQYCMRCTHPMIQVTPISRHHTMYQCSQHAAKNPCTYARNGHHPPGDHHVWVLKAESDRKIRLWQDHNTVITTENVKISGETLNPNGQMFKNRTYREIFENGPHYVDWVMWIVDLDLDATAELKHISSFFTAAKDCRLLCRSNESALGSDYPKADRRSKSAPVLSSPNASGSTDSPSQISPKNRRKPKPPPRPPGYHFDEKPGHTPRQHLGSPGHTLEDRLRRYSEMQVRQIQKLQRLAKKETSDKMEVDTPNL